MWAAAVSAFLSDPSYAIEMATVGSQQAVVVARSEDMEFSGV